MWNSTSRPATNSWPRLARLAQHLAIERARRERHRAAVAEIQVAQHPARRRCPGQHAEGGGIRHHQHVGRALHLFHTEAAAGGEHGKHRAVRGVFREHGGGDGAAALQRGDRLRGDDGLAAQNAVLVGEGEADDLEILLLDDAAHPRRRVLLLIRPQRMTRDESHLGIPPVVRREACAISSVIARSPCDEAIQSSSAGAVWIASLRSQ